MAIFKAKKKTDRLPPAELSVVFWKSEKDIPFQGSEARLVTHELKRRGATGEAHETHAVSLAKGRSVRIVFAVGLGEKPSIDTVRRGVAASVQYAKSVNIHDIAVIAPEGMQERIGIAVAEGVELGGYAFTAYLPKKAREERKRSIRQVSICVEKKDVESVKRQCETGKRLALATIFARDLVNEPALSATPEALADTARDIARKSKGNITVEIADRKECELRGMGAFLAVAQGASSKPQFIHLAYRPEHNEKRTHIALIGKGITFDSGGLSLKPSEGMETMKIDMAGAATVLGVFSQLSVMRPDVEVHGYIAACENMPAGNAIRPGDIVRSASGKTIEIRNTDAEGRLTLADAITEAKKLHPDMMIDLATLTGSCVAALGEEVAGLFCNTPELSKRIVDAANAEGECVWEMPLVNDYRPFIKSTVADVRNIGTRKWAGAITAALFLEEFVEKTPWAHIDIAGPAFAEQQTNPVVPEGGSGFGVRMLLYFLQKLGEKRAGMVS